MIVRELITRLGYQIDQSKLTQFDRSVGAMRDKLLGASKNMGKVADSFVGLGTKLSLFVTTPLIAANVAMIKVASSMEQLQVSFEVMLESAEKGNALMQDMFEFAKNTPFEIRNIGPTVKQLLAMGIESEKVIKTLGFLGDVSSGLNVPLGRLALNLGQVKTQGKLTGRELRDFAVAGVPLLDELSKITSKTKAEIQNMISAGEINYDMVEKAFISMTSEGGKFFKLMERQSKTLGGLFSNFMDNLFLTAGAIGEVVVEVLKLKKVVGATNNFMGKLLNIFKNLSRPIQTVIVFISLLLASVGPLLIAIGGLIKILLFLNSTLAVIKTAFYAASLAGAGFNLTLIALPALILSVIVALGLLVDDIIGWINKQDSLIGDVLGPWEEWRDSMLEFFGMVKNGLKDLLTGDIDKLIQKGKLLAKTFGFFFDDLSETIVPVETATKFFSNLEKNDPSKIDKIVYPYRNLSSEQKKENLLKSGMANTPNGVGRNINISAPTTIQVTANTNASASDIALEVGNAVGAEMKKVFRDTITINQD